MAAPNEPTVLDKEQVSALFFIVLKFLPFEVLIGFQVCPSLEIHGQIV